MKLGGIDMVEPITTAAVVKTAAPFLIKTIGQSIYERLFPDEAKQIQLEVLEDLKNFKRMLSRQSRGVFTSAERQAIKSGAEPTVNRIAGGVAARGLGGSGAGAQVIAQAQQAPFLQAQTAATQALSAADARLFRMAGKLVRDDNFYNDINKVTQNIAKLWTDEEEEVDTETDRILGLI